MSDQPKYTTAIIAAVPASDDPVHAHVIEDAHVTLQFLGEADSLSPEQVEDIRGALELLSSNLYPFPAEVAGTAELGPDKAKVLLVQSEPLTKIRELLATVPAVSTAVAAAEQFPNWIPHLTLAYAEDGQVEAPDLDQVTIGSLELWLADEQHAYPLAKAAPGPVEEDEMTASVIAAGLKEFDSTLHPRGADGRFIEKFGVVKYLTGQGWAYGKVEGIYKDQASGAVKITVTPSDLNGKASGAESLELSPKQLYRAPKAKAHLTTQAIGAKKIGGQGGSNPGGMYEIPKTKAEDPDALGTDKFYVKKPKTPQHGKNEALANALYEEAGVPVPEVDYASDGNLYSKIIEGKQDMSSQLNNAEWTDQVRRNFAVDAWLGNRDVFGMTYDNILTDPHGTPWRIDNGGALLYRAMGEKKTDFGAQVTELDAFRQGKKAKIYGPQMTKAQELDGAERVVAILPTQIDELVADHGLPKSLADTLKARRQYIASYYGLTLPESKKAPEAEPGTAAPLVDAPDIAASGGKARTWHASRLNEAMLLAQPGDRIELPDGTVQTVGQDINGDPLSVIGQASQLLSWQNKYGADAGIYLKKKVDLGSPRPQHGSKLSGSDLPSQRWQRGDEIVSPDGEVYKVKGWNSTNGAVLVQAGDAEPRLLDTAGADGVGVWEVRRWDKPAVTPEEALPEAPAVVQALPEPEETPEPAPEQAPAIPEPAPGKTGQAAVAEAAIKKDLDQPLPTGTGAPAPAKTSAPGGAKKMVVGDGTEASTGDEVVSKKDGKTYVFVKPKGQYAVVTDPNGDDPQKQLLKLASTMTQPGKAPAADVEGSEKPKTASGEVPELGMMAEAKDGWAGEITLISPDGKFVFITDATGKRKRKSTGTVTITSAPKTVAEAVDTAPKTLPGPIKEYGAKPHWADWKGSPKKSGFADYGDLTVNDLVLVGYADGTHGLEPYTGQPLDSLAQNIKGQVAQYKSVDQYVGPISTGHLIAATAAKNNAHDYQVVWDGKIWWTNGKTGPDHGGLVLLDKADPASYAYEIPNDQVVTLTMVMPDTMGPGVLPDFDSIGSAQSGPASSAAYPTLLPLYGDEAKTPGQWKADGVIFQPGQQISVDGKHWLTVQSKIGTAGGSYTVKDENGTKFDLIDFGNTTVVLKAPGLVDGDTQPSKMTPAPEASDPEGGVPGASVAIGELVKGDAVQFPDGSIDVVSDVLVTGGNEASVTSWASPFGATVPADQEVQKLGNIHEGPVDMPIGQIIDNVYPGVTIHSGVSTLKVLSYPKDDDAGNKIFAAVLGEDIDNPILVKVGPTGEIAEGATVGVHFTPSAFPVEQGVDPDKVGALFAKDAVQDPQPINHNVSMGEQGVPYGTAQYPIYYNPVESSYYRQGPEGVEWWHSSEGAWEAAPEHPTVAGMEKVWDGVPFTGELTVPEDFPGTVFLNGQNYKPEPGETIVAVDFHPSSGGDPQTVLMAMPEGYGPDKPAYVITGTDGGKKAAKSNPLSTYQNKPSVYQAFQVIHDPYDDESNQPEPVQVDAGTGMPDGLADLLTQKGYTPEPGAQHLFMQNQSGEAPSRLYVLDASGNYKLVKQDGQFGAAGWTAEELREGFGTKDWKVIPWTAPSEDGEGPVPVQGLPPGYAPYVPGEGQSLLKVTLPNGNQQVYLQKQPESGWYLMAPDGLVNESSDAIKSNHIVQAKLAGKGSQAAAKYELLHPKPEGVKETPDSPPTFSTHHGSWTPEPGQKVAALTSGPDDPNPWYYVQTEPGGDWVPALGPAYMNGHADEVMQAELGKPGSGYELVWGGQGGDLAAVDTAAPDNGAGAATPTFDGYVPNPDDKVISYTSVDGQKFYYVQPPGKKNWYGIGGNGEVSDFVGIYADDLPGNLGPEFGNDYAQEWPLPGGAPGADAAAPAVFDGYEVSPGDQVVHLSTTGAHYVKPGGQGINWFRINKNTGTTGSIALDDAAIQSNLDSGTGTMVYGGDATPDVPAAPPAAPTFNGYAPQNGDVVMAWTPPSGNTIYLVKQSGSPLYKTISNGQVNQSGGLTQDEIDSQDLQGSNQKLEQVFPAGGATGGTFDGYQSQPDESVVLVSGNIVAYHMVKKDDGWHKIENGQLTDVYDQDTIEWLADPEGGSGSTVQVVQGSIKGEPVTAEPLTPADYSGVKEVTQLTPGSISFGGYQLTDDQAHKIFDVQSKLMPGTSIYALESDYGSGGVLIRTSVGTWKTIYGDGTLGTIANTDDELEQYLSNAGYTLHKGTFTAPANAPAAPSLGPAPSVSVKGWQGNVPDPASFGQLQDPATDAVGLKAGTHIFIGGSSDTGLFMEIAEDVTDPGNIKVTNVYPLNLGTVGPKIYDKDKGEVSPGWTLLNSSSVYVTGQPGTATPAPSPVQAVPSVPEPAKPSYPGAQKPSQEDVNAWGGELTKDGHIPTSGMYVTGKGPMAGKIVSVSKDKTKATVFTSDGKKTTRLISALKTDLTANYQAYAAPVTAKDIPQGMPLAVDTVAEALEKTVKDGKFRAILSAHPGVSQGAITVTKATGPSGKAYNRVHLTLTPAQREQLVAMLAGSGEKGDWATSSKMSDQVSVGDLLPMRLSSTPNPDGTPRWKVDPAQVPPTHEVTGVTDDPSASGVKIVTLKHRDTGEEITSRFHPGKSLTTYAWDPNKPKPKAPGAFSLNDIAKADGWTFTTDGGISAATGGAQDAKLKVEPGKPVNTGQSALGQIQHSWKTLRNVSANGVVVELVDPQGSSKQSSTGTTVISVPEGLDETALGAAFAKLGIDYSPMTQDSAKTSVRGLLRTLLQLDMNDVDTPKGWTDEKLFAEAGKVMGISDLGWQDVLVGVDESIGKTSFFWSDRARTALAGKAKYNVVYRAASTANAAQIVSTVKYGSASSMAKKTTGMLDGSSSVGNGASASSDNSNHAGHGSYASASKVGKLPSSNSLASYKSAGMMVYHRPEAVLGRIMDYRVANSDAFGAGQGQGSNHLAHATSMSQVRDYFLGGGLPTEAVGFIAVQDAGERNKAIEQLKKDGYAVINGRPVEDIIITKQKAATLTPDDLPPVTIPANARPITSLPTSYDAPAVTAAADEDTAPAENLEVEVA